MIIFFLLFSMRISNYYGLSWRIFNKSSTSKIISYSVFRCILKKNSPEGQRTENIRNKDRNSGNLKKKLKKFIILCICTIMPNTFKKSLLVSFVIWIKLISYLLSTVLTKAFARNRRHQLVEKVSNFISLWSSSILNGILSTHKIYLNMQGLQLKK